MKSIETKRKTIFPIKHAWKCGDIFSLKWGDDSDGYRDDLDWYSINMCHLNCNSFQTQHASSPVSPPGVVPDFISCMWFYHPLGNQMILLLFLGQESLDSESLVSRHGKKPSQPQSPWWWRKVEGTKQNRKDKLFEANMRQNEVHYKKNKRYQRISRWQKKITAEKLKSTGEGILSRCGKISPW